MTQIAPRAQLSAWFGDRLAHAGLALRPGWRWLLAALAFVGAIQTVAAVFNVSLPPWIRIPHLPLLTWLCVFLVVAACSIFEGTLGEVRRLQWVVGDYKMRMTDAVRAIGFFDHDLPIGTAFVAMFPAEAQDRDFLDAGRILRDLLAVGDLQAWGRPPSVGVFERETPLTRIDPNYWVGADWTYAFLEEAERRHPDTSVNGPQGPAYSDVRLSRARFVTLFPETRSRLDEMAQAQG